MKFLSEASLPDQPLFIQPKKQLTAIGYGAAKQERRQAWDELWRAADDLQSLTQNTNARGRAMQEAYGARNRDIIEATGEDPNDISREERARLLKLAGPDADIEDVTRQAYQQRLKDIAARHPDKADIIRADVPIEQDAMEFSRWSERQAAAADKRANDAGLGKAGKFGAALGGGFRAMMRDPVQVGTLFLGGGAGTAKTIGGKILQTVLTEAIVNGGVEAVVQAASHDWKKKAGLDASFGTALAQVGLAAAFGGGFGGLLEGGRQAIKALNAPVDPIVLEQAIAGEPAAVRAVAEAIGRPLDKTDEHALAGAAAASEADTAAFGADLTGDNAAPQLADKIVAAIENDQPLPDLKKQTRKVVTPQQAQADRILNEVAPAAPRARQPVSLNRFLANQGGIADHGGELAALDAKKLFVPGSGRLVREGGKSLDYAREAAAEAGYFDHIYGDSETAMQLSTVTDLLDAIDSDMRGQKIYSSQDQNLIDTATTAAAMQAARDEARVAIQSVIDQAQTPLPDAIIKRAVELHSDMDDAADALERAIMEDYNNAGFDLPMERADGTAIEIPFFDDGAGLPAQRQAAAGSGQDGRAGQGAENAADGGQPVGTRQDQTAGEITPETLAPAVSFEPGTKQSGELAALALTEAAGRNAPASAAAEKTDAGLQVLIPGVGEVTIKEKLDLQAAKPMRGGNAAPGGLFDDTKTKQLDIMDMIPAGTDADGNVRHVSHADMIDDADRHDFFGDLIASCKD